MIHADMQPNTKARIDAIATLGRKRQELENAARLNAIGHAADDYVNVKLAEYKHALGVVVEAAKLEGRANAEADHHKGPHRELHQLRRRLGRRDPQRPRRRQRLRAARRLRDRRRLLGAHQRRARRSRTQPQAGRLVALAQRKNRTGELTWDDARQKKITRPIGCSS